MIIVLNGLVTLRWSVVNWSSMLAGAHRLHNNLPKNRVLLHENINTNTSTLLCSLIVVGAISTMARATFLSLGLIMFLKLNSCGCRDVGLDDDFESKKG